MVTQLTYKEALLKANTLLAADPKILYVGYGLKRGRALGTLRDISEKQIIEMPVAENLMTGFAIGLSLKDYKPIVFIERMDFLMNALDAIVNHLDKIRKKSGNECGSTTLVYISLWTLIGFIRKINQSTDIGEQYSEYTHTAPSLLGTQLQLWY